MSEKYSENLKEVIQVAQSRAKRAKHGTYGVAHLLLALFRVETGIETLLLALGKDVDYIKEWASMRLEMYPEQLIPNEQAPTDDEAAQVFKEAVRNQIVLGTDYIDPHCVFLSIITPGVVYSSAQLKTLGITPKEFLNGFDLDFSAGTSEEEYLANDRTQAPTATVASKNGIPYCSEYKKHLSEDLNRIIGREEEIRAIQETFHRFYNVGVLIVGDAGVGRTALIEAFAKELNYGKSEQKPKLISCDLLKLTTGAQGSVEYASRLQKVFQAIRKSSKDTLLIMDNLQLLLSDNATWNTNILALIADEIDRHGISVIMTITRDSFRRNIENESALIGKVETVEIEELSKENTLKCLQNHVAEFAEHYHLEISDDSLKESIYLAQRYFKDKKLPYSAIQLIDKTLSAVKVSNESSQGEISKLSKLIEEQRKELYNTSTLDAEKEFFNELKWIHSRILKGVSPIIQAHLKNTTEAKKITEPAVMLNYLDEIIGELWDLSTSPITQVSSTEIAAIVAEATGIPMGKIQSQEKDKLLNIGSYLKRRVVGQDQAINSIAEAVVESRSGINEAGQPIGSFFFLGPTGTGKTELAKTIAEFLFDDEKSMIRFDMSEFKEEHSAALLYGAPPGYVGYQEGGLLVTKIRQQPYSVVLFDEIEKAHSSVYDVFLQIMDEGQIHDKLGRKGDFSNAIIIFTSNIGSEWIAEQFREGRIPESKELIDIMAGNFRPEFLGRLTEIIPFGPISKDVVGMIFNIQLNKLRQSLDRRRIKIELSDTAISYFSSAGYSEKYGARPVASVIRSQIKRPIARKLVAGEIDNDMNVLIDYAEDKGIHWHVTAAQTVE